MSVLAKRLHGPLGMIDTLGWRVLGVAFAIAIVAGPAARAAGPDGARLYQRNCAPCHGTTGRGDGPDARLFASPPRNLREGFLARYTTDDLVRRVRTGEPLTLALDPPALRLRAGEVEALASHLERLSTVNWRLAERGQEIFTDRCEICHGPGGRPGTTRPPGVRLPRDLADPAFQRAISDDELRTVVRHGRSGMPALVPRVPESDVPALIAFVRLLSPGFEIYERYCSACHGDDGKGAGSFGEALPRPTVVFDRAYFTRRDPEEVRAKVWHMLADQRPAMPHFRTTLTEAEARAIVTYLKQTE